MLREDGIDRGRHAIHVHRQPKLGKHRTVIKPAAPFVNLVIGILRLLLQELTPAFLAMCSVGYRLSNIHH